MIIIKISLFFYAYPLFCSLIYIINENILRIWYNRYKYDSYISLVCSFLGILYISYHKNIQIGLTARINEFYPKLHI